MLTICWGPIVSMPASPLNTRVTTTTTTTNGAIDVIDAERGEGGADIFLLLGNPFYYSTTVEEEVSWFPKRVRHFITPFLLVLLYYIHRYVCMYIGRSILEWSDMQASRPQTALAYYVGAHFLLPRLIPSPNSALDARIIFSRRARSRVVVVVVDSRRLPISQRKILPCCSEV